MSFRHATDGGGQGSLAGHVGQVGHLMRGGQVMGSISGDGRSSTPTAMASSAHRTMFSQDKLH